ncbi:MAG: hypothetical protein ACTSYC_03590 [Promethearchaeota archaeon]
MSDRSMSIPSTPATCFILRILNFRIRFLFVAISIYFSYLLKVKAFEEGYNKIEHIYIIALGIFTFFFALIVYDGLTILLNVLAFLLILIYVVSIYILFLIKVLSSYRIIEEKNSKLDFWSYLLWRHAFYSYFLIYY